MEKSKNETPAKSAKSTQPIQPVQLVPTTVIPVESNYKFRYRKEDIKYFIRDFVEKQISLLNIEREEEEKQTLDNIFTFSARDLEKRGVCIRKLDLIETVYESYGKYLTQFQKRTTKDIANKLCRYKIGNGDIVGLFEYSYKVHVEPLYKGVVLEFNEKKILVAFDEEIEADKLPKNICLVQLCNQITYERIKEGLDTLDNMSGVNEDCMKLISVLFGVSEPTFRNELREEEEEKHKFDFDFYNENLNISQKEAVRFCMETNELGLIHGPPGTGKTTTVVELILQSIKNGLKILVVAPSNIAVDNLAEKLVAFKHQLNFDLCRIGHPARILESIIDISLSSKVEKSSNMKFVKEVKRDIEKVRKELNKTEKYMKDKRYELKRELRSLREDIKGSYRTTAMDIYSKSQVILATCVGSADSYLKEALDKFHQGTFDLVVIDECAQATESVCWISILIGKKLVLAGDHLQLPPTIKSQQAQKELGFTLFDRMIQLYGEKCSRLLNVQYRMNEDIMNFSSKELYKGKLIADASVKDHKVIDLVSNKSNASEPEDKLSLLNKNLVYVDTNGFEFYESVDLDSASKFNLGEAKICRIMVDYLKTNNVTHKSIGIITPYSAQVNMLRQHMPVDEYKDLEISTVDGFQGREKEIIILTLVRSNKKKEVGFLADSRRLNVAITRARRMIALVCDESTVSNHPFLKKMCNYFSQKAHPVNLVDDIMDFKEIEDIKYECAKTAEEDKVNNKRETLTDGKVGKKKNKKNKKEHNTENNVNDLEINKTNETNYNNHNNHTETHNHNHHHNLTHGKKEEPNIEFINKIQSLIEVFMDSKEDEYRIEGLNNVERKYLHCYAEIKSLIHESHGEGDNRVLILRKKHRKAKKSPNKTEDNSLTPSKEIIKHQVHLPVPTQVHVSVSTHVAVTQNKLEQNKAPLEQTRTKAPSNSVSATVTANHKVKVEANWDEIDSLLNGYQTKDKEKCNFGYCANKKDNSLCHYCNLYFCINHLRGVVHDCEIYNKQDDGFTSKIIKNSLSQKISEMEGKRNKKPSDKKKKK